MARAAWLAVAAAPVAAAVPVDESNVLALFKHAPGLRCKTRMFSAPFLPPEEMPMLQRMQQAAHWCALHPGCFGVQLYDGGEEDMGYCMKWCGRPQWCLSPMLESDGETLKAEELVEDKLFFLFVKPPHGSYTMAAPLAESSPARCSFAGHVGPCFEPSSCRKHNFRAHGRALVFTDDLRRPALWLSEESYMVQMLKWATPNLVDVVLILPESEVASYPISAEQRLQLQELGVVLHEVPWVRPALGKGIPRWAQEFWCVDRDFFKLHVLGLDYDAVIFFDSDVFVEPQKFQELDAVFDCAYQGYFLATALHGGFEALTIAFFALRPHAPLLRAVQRFLLNSSFDDDLGWNFNGFGPWGCLDGTDRWCFHCYHVGGECGQGLFYDLFYMADQIFWSALEAEPGAVRPLGVMLDGCKWLYENSLRVRGFPIVPSPCADLAAQGRCGEVIAYHKVIEGRGCASELGGKPLRLFPSDEGESLYIGSTQPTYAM
ncbi:unnamed protein product [Effrenium voratum]|nr:unnamed protein product [Effrenium voratum]